MSAERSYSALLDCRPDRAPGMEGLLLKEKLGGKSVVSHSLDRFDEDPRCVEVLVLAEAGTHDWIAHDPLTFASGKLQLLPADIGLAAALEEAREQVVVYHDARRPNWQPALLDSLLRAWHPGMAALPLLSLDGELLRRGSDVGQTSAPATAAEGIFGGHKTQQTQVLSAVEQLNATHYGVTETPQVWDGPALAKAVGGHEVPTGLAEAALATGMTLHLLPARPHNFRVADGDGLHLLRRLLGEAKKGSKDRYGGLGW